MNKMLITALTTLRNTALLFTLVLSSTAWSADKNIAVVVFDGVLTSDVTAPIEVFGAASKKAWFSDYKVTVISSTREKSIHTEEGLNIVADKTIYDGGDYDVVLVASAYDMDPSLENAPLIDFIRRQGQQASWMASNCSGAFLLAEAGMLDGKRATTWAGGEKGLARAYPKVNVEYDRNVVVDDGVITSNGGPVSYQSAFVLLGKLSSEAFANEISEQIQFNRLKTAF